MSADTKATIGAILIVIIFLAIPIAIEGWRYSECKSVGHGTAYCLFFIGGNGS